MLLRDQAQQEVHHDSQATQPLPHLPSLGTETDEAPSPSSVKGSDCAGVWWLRGLRFRIKHQTSKSTSITKAAKPPMRIPAAALGESVSWLLLPWETP